MSKKNKVLVVVLAFLVAVEFALVMVYFARVKNTKLLVDLANPKTTTIEKIMNGVFVITDVALAGALVVLLHRSRSGFLRTDSIIKQLIAYTLSTR